MNRSMLWLLALSACTWVSQDDLDDRLGQLDDDGDGFTRDGGGNPARADCDDTDPQIHPSADEVWYDGVDQDCDGANDYDQDADGYVIEGCTDPVWCGATVAGGDCDDERSDVHPDAVDDVYDGTDANCDGSNDFDLDGDGYDSADYGGDDCADDDAAVNPGATEIWYDGTDQDCSGGSDFDQDGDGEDSTLAAGGFDCDDNNVEVYPGATDSWYDGIDSNCDGLNDYDQDGDGYVEETCTDAVYCGPDQAGGDCDDDDALIYPYAEEVFDDSVDGDCDGDPDGVRLYTLPVEYKGAQSLRGLDYESQVLFSVVADEHTYGAAATWFDTASWGAVSFFPPYVSGPEARWEVEDAEAWTGENLSDLGSLSMSVGQDVLVDKVDGRDFFCGATGQVSSTARTLRLSCFQVADSGGLGRGSLYHAADSPSLASVVEFSDVTQARDAEANFHVFGCSDGGGLQYLITSDQDMVSTDGGTVTTSAYYPDLNAVACRVHFFESSGLGRLAYIDADTLEYVELSFDPLLNADGLSTEASAVFTEVVRTAAPAPRSFDWPQDASSLVMALLNTSGNVAVYVGGVTGSKWAVTYHEDTVVDAHIDASPLGDWYLAWAEVTGEGGVTWGNDTSGFTGAGRITADFGFDEIYPIYAEGTDHLYIVAISGTQVAVGAVLAPVP